jgi:methylated-DNA-[protein]-cysteine S-methyltransferase
MATINFQYYPSSLGELIIAEYQNQLVICDWRFRKSSETIKQRIQTALDAEMEECSTPIIVQTIQQIEEYIAKQRTQFDIDFKLIGSDFQKKVWRELQEIPYGKTISYLALSKKLGNEKAIRAVATANGANALAIIIPCHRVIGSTGELVGYAGGLAIKKKLLILEGADIFNQMSLGL